MCARVARHTPLARPAWRLRVGIGAHVSERTFDNPLFAQGTGDGDVDGVDVRVEQLLVAPVSAASAAPAATAMTTADPWHGHDEQVRPSGPSRAAAFLLPRVASDRWGPSSCEAAGRPAGPSLQPGRGQRVMKGAQVQRIDACRGTASRSYGSGGGHCPRGGGWRGRMHRRRALWDTRGGNAVGRRKRLGLLQAPARHGAARCVGRFRHRDDILPCDRAGAQDPPLDRRGFR